MTHNEKLIHVTQQLNEAYGNRNKRAILALYDEAAEIDFDKCEEDACEAYEAAIDECNDYLLG